MRLPRYVGSKDADQFISELTLTLPKSSANATRRQILGFLYAWINEHGEIREGLSPAIVELQHLCNDVANDQPSKVNFELLRQGFKGINRPENVIHLIYDFCTNIQFILPEFCKAKAIEILLTSSKIKKGAEQSFMESIQYRNVLETYVSSPSLRESVAFEDFAIRRNDLRKLRRLVMRLIKGLDNLGDQSDGMQIQVEVSLLEQYLKQLRNYAEDVLEDGISRKRGRPVGTNQTATRDAWAFYMHHQYGMGFTEFNDKFPDMSFDTKDTYNKSLSDTGKGVNLFGWNPQEDESKELEKLTKYSDGTWESMVTFLTGPDSFGARPGPLLDEIFDLADFLAKLSEINMSQLNSSR